MPSVREAAFDLLRAHGMTTMFGNPGSTELPMLADFPGDFRYVLALQEAVAVGMADGFAQASGTVGHVNLHTAPGVGNAMGAIFNAQANKAPLLVTAGQQVRAQMTYQANLTNRDATRMPHPLVKWSYEPPRAAGRAGRARARRSTWPSLPPAGPVFVSLPMDDWAAEADAGDAERTIARRVSGAAGADPEAVAALAAALDAASSPVMVAGGDLDACGAWDAGRRAGREGGPAGVGHARAGRRADRLPREPPALPRRAAAGDRARRARRWRATTSCSWPAARCSPTTPTSPVRRCPTGAELVAITRDPDEAARAPVGDAIVADPRLTLEALTAAVAARPAPEPAPAPPPVEDSDPISGGQVHSVLADVLPDDGIVVVESPSSTAALRTRLRIARPGSYYFSAGGGLGFGLAAGIGVQLAQPDRPVVCVLGEGSAQYAVTGFWTAAAYDVPVTFLVLNNSEYSILKWFAGMEQVEGAPGLDFAGLDTAGRGVRVRRALAQGRGHRGAARGAHRGVGLGRARA